MTEVVLGLGLLVLVLAALSASVSLTRAGRATTIYPPQIGLLYRAGNFVRELPPGHYRRFDPFGRERILVVSVVEQPVPLAALTLLSKDQFSFRLGLTVLLKVTDARLYVDSQPHAHDQIGGGAGWLPATTIPATLQPLVAAAAMEAVAARTLSEVMAEPAAVLDAILAQLAGAVSGAAVTRLLLTGLTLPPETRRMFTEVERARLEGQAALERARAEQAALRVLANAARLVTDNPALAQLRLLQAIETSKGPTTIVVGEGAGLARAGGAPSSS